MIGVVFTIAVLIAFWTGYLLAKHQIKRPDFNVIMAQQVSRQFEEATKHWDTSPGRSLAHLEAAQRILESLKQEDPQELSEQSYESKTIYRR